MSNGGVEINDSVVMGDVHNITQNIDNSGLTCPSCGTMGSIALFTCSQTSCINKFCNYCEYNDFPGLCGVCVDLEIASYEEGRRLEELEKKRIEQMRQQAILDELEHKRKIWDEQRRARKSISVSIVRTRYFSLPFIHVVCLFALYSMVGALESKGFYSEDIFSGLVPLSIGINLVIYYAGISFSSERLFKAEQGMDVNTAFIIAVSPILSVFTVLVFSFVLEPRFISVAGVLAWITIGFYFVSLGGKKKSK